MQESFLAAPLLPPLSALDADLCVLSLTKVLHVAAKAASPLQCKKRSRKGFPIWNERVAAAVQSSKTAHYRWKRASCPRGNSGLLKQKKEARYQVLQLSTWSTRLMSSLLLLPTWWIISTHVGIFLPWYWKALWLPCKKKKDKDPTLATDYRGITVLSIIGKVLEKVLQRRTEDILIQNQSRLQRGFTKKSSSINAVLLISVLLGSVQFWSAWFEFTIGCFLAPSFGILSLNYTTLV